MRTIPAESRLVLTVAVLSVAGAALCAEVISRHFETLVEEAGSHVLTAAAEAFTLQHRAEVEKLSSTLDPLMASTQLQAAFRAGDRDRLQALCRPLLETMRERSRITHWYFHTADPKPTVFLRVHRPELYGDASPRVTLLRAVESGGQGAGLELGKTALALRVVRPWYVDGKLLGYLELAEEVDHLLATMNGRAGDEYGLLVRKDLVDPVAWATAVEARATRWDSSAEVLVLGASGEGGAIPDWDGDVQALPPAGRWLGEVHRHGRAFIRGVYPVADAAGRRVGALTVVHDFTSHHGALREGRAFALAVLLALAVFGTAALAVLLRLTVFGRLTQLRLRLERRAAGDAGGGAGGGDAAGGQPNTMVSHDDLGRLEVLFDRALGAPPPADRPKDG